MKNLVENKRIIVTGSASGIGHETARVLSEQGAEVLGVDLNKNFDHVEEWLIVNARRHDRERLEERGDESSPNIAVETTVRTPQLRRGRVSVNRQ